MRYSTPTPTFSEMCPKMITHTKFQPSKIVFNPMFQFSLVSGNIEICHPAYMCQMSVHKEFQILVLYYVLLQHKE